MQEHTPAGGRAILSAETRASLARQDAERTATHEREVNAHNVRFYLSLAARFPHESDGQWLAHWTTPGPLAPAPFLFAPQNNRERAQWERATRPSAFQWEIDLRRELEGKYVVPKGDAEKQRWRKANLRYCSRWVCLTWRPASRCLLRVLPPEALRELPPPTDNPLIGDVHRLFSRLLVAELSWQSVRRLIRDVATMREELGTHRHEIGRYFGWLRRELDAIWAPQSVKPPQREWHDPKPMKKHEWQARAMLLVNEHPDRSTARIARDVGRHPSQLSRCPAYQRAAHLARTPKQNRPAGYVTIDPETGLRDVEAHTDDEGKIDRRRRPKKSDN